MLLGEAGSLRTRRTSKLIFHFSWLQFKLLPWASYFNWSLKKSELKQCHNLIEYHIIIIILTSSNTDMHSDKIVTNYLKNTLVEPHYIQLKYFDVNKWNTIMDLVPKHYWLINTSKIFITDYYLRFFIYLYLLMNSLGHSVAVSTTTNELIRHLDMYFYFYCYVYYVVILRR